MGDPVLAEEMISAACESGADISKFQYWDPSLLKSGDWDNDGRREIYNKAALDIEKINRLEELCENSGCEFLLSVFGTKGAELISRQGQEKVKIPSHETTNLKLLELASNTFSYIYFSAGASTTYEVEKAVSVLKNGNAEFSLLHCVSSYPVKDEFANLGRLDWLRKFGVPVGLSDHTQSTLVPAISVGFGAEIIEKHFTIDKNLPGRDNKFALNPDEFKLMTENIKVAVGSIIDRGLDFQEIENDTVNHYRGRWEPDDYA